MMNKVKYLLLIIAALTVCGCVYSTLCGIKDINKARSQKNKATEYLYPSDPLEGIPYYLRSLEIDYDHNAHDLMEVLAEEYKDAIQRQDSIYMFTQLDSSVVRILLNGSY